MRRITLVAAVFGAVAMSAGVVTSAPAAPATFPARDAATGPTLSAATSAAHEQLLVDYRPCFDVMLIADKQLSNGPWRAAVAGSCSVIH